VVKEEYRKEQKGVEEWISSDVNIDTGGARCYLDVVAATLPLLIDRVMALNICTQVSLKQCVAQSIDGITCVDPLLYLYISDSYLPWTIARWHGRKKARFTRFIWCILGMHKLWVGTQNDAWSRLDGPSMTSWRVIADGCSFACYVHPLYPLCFCFYLYILMHLFIIAMCISNSSETRGDTQADCGSQDEETTRFDPTNGLTLLSVIKNNRFWFSIEIKGFCIVYHQRGHFHVRTLTLWYRPCRYA
jgi:hypothetical protein